MPDVLWVLIWVQTFCKSYQQMTLVSKEFMTTIQANQGYTLNFKSITYLPAKAISLINFVNNRSQVPAKNVGHYLDPYCLITYLYS